MLLLKAFASLLFYWIFSLPVQVLSDDLFMTVIAGTSLSGYTGNGAATSAKLYSPSAVWPDSNGNVYIADYSNYRVRRVDGITGLIANAVGSGSQGYGFADGTGTSVVTTLPFDLVGDVLGQFLYISDKYHIWKYDLTTKIATRYAGGKIQTTGSSGDNDPATSAVFNQIAGLHITPDNTLYLVDTFACNIRKILPNGIIKAVSGSTLGFGGDGSTALSTAVQYNLPRGIFLDTNDIIYIADQANRRVRYINNAGIVNTFAGGGNSFIESMKASSALIGLVNDICGDLAGNMFISSGEFSFIYKVNVFGSINRYLGSGIGGSVVGTTPAASPIFSPRGLYYDNSNNVLYFTEERGHLAKKTISISSPTSQPSSVPSVRPSHPSSMPSGYPSTSPTLADSGTPSSIPSNSPTTEPSLPPTGTPSSLPSGKPTGCPSTKPSERPSTYPTDVPMSSPSSIPTTLPSPAPTGKPSCVPSVGPSSVPTFVPTSKPSSFPIALPTGAPTTVPSTIPSAYPSSTPSVFPSRLPTMKPSTRPSVGPTGSPSRKPSSHPSSSPSLRPSVAPSSEPSAQPTSPSFVPTLAPNVNDIVQVSGKLIVTTVYSDSLNNKSMTTVSDAVRNISASAQQAKVTSVKLVSKKGRFFWQETSYTFSFEIGFIAVYYLSYYPGWNSSYIAETKLNTIKKAVQDGSFQQVLRNLAYVKNATSLLVAECGEVSLSAVVISNDYSEGTDGDNERLGDGIVAGIVVGCFVVGFLFVLFMGKYFRTDGTRRIHTKNEEILV
jgi:hypothetical protein